MSRLEPRNDGLSNTLTSVEKDNYLQEWDKKIRIRKMTPRECWRLMGVRDADIDKVTDGSISKAQLYKMAGNSIVVDVMARMFEQIFYPVRENGSLF